MLGVLHATSLGGLIEQTIYLTPLHQMLLNNLPGILRPDLSVKGIIGQYFDYGTFLTKPEASGHDHLNLILEVVLL